MMISENVSDHYLDLFDFYARATDDDLRVIR